jgi:hypothetical protein
MAGANLTVHGPILQVQNKANTTPYTNALPEAAGQAFQSGVPVQLNGSGYVQQWDGTTHTAGILGVSESFGLNLGTAGAGAPTPPFGGITGTIAIQTYGSVPNEANAVNIAIGTPVSDGRTLYMEPNSDNIFQALFDNSAGAVAADYTPTVTDVGAKYGLTKDSTWGYWYVDKNLTSTNAVVQIVGLPFGSYVNAPVNFVFLTAAVQIL